MSSEIIIKKNSKNIELDAIELEKTLSGSQISNKDLNKLIKNSSNKKKSKICINTLREKLRKKEIKKKFENRIVYGLFVSVVAVLFYVST